MTSFSFESMLATTELFGQLSHEEIGPFAAKSQLQTFEAGQVITQQGDLGTGLYVITEGSVDVVHDRGEPSETQVATLKEGDFFGDLALLLERPRGASVVAREFTKCLVLVRWDFKDLALESPKVLWAMLEVVAGRLTDTDQPIEHNL